MVTASYKEVHELQVTFSRKMGDIFYRLVTCYILRVWEMT